MKEKKDTTLRGVAEDGNLMTGACPDTPWVLYGYSYGINRDSVVSTLCCLRKQLTGV